MTSMRPVFEEFEPRILYSADLAPLMLAGLADQQIDAQPAAAQGTLQHEIAFVDLSLPDAQALIDDLNAQARAGRAIEVLTIGSGVDGIELISHTLAERDNIAAVHLLSHGDNGVVQLGSSRLDAASLLARAGEVAAWRAALTNDADLLIYGCDVAAQTDGVALIDGLAALTGADVAASDDLTGAARHGGDWALEVNRGHIEAQAALTQAAQQSWAGVMLVTTNELQVNQNTNNDQLTTAENRGSQQAVALDAAGNYVIVWTSTSQDGSGMGVYARRFDTTGAALSNEVLVNTTTNDNQRSARVVSDNAGNFIVTWTSSNQDGSGNGVYFRRFDAGGGAMTGEIRANATATGSQADSVIAMNSSTGAFVIVWQGEGPGDTAGIFFRRFNADGSAIDLADRRGNAVDGGTENDPAVVMDSTGRFAIAWEQGNHLYFERFDAAGVSQGARVQVDNGLSTSSGPAMAVDAAGNFTVVYREENILPGIWGRSFNADGSNKGTWFYVGAGDATSPSIDMAADGSFVVVYENTGDGDDMGVFGHKYNADGSAAGASFQINQTTATDQLNASVSLADTSNYVVVWSGKSATDAHGVVARQFSASSAAPMITSNGGGGSANPNVAENTNAVTTVTATDADAATTLTYSIVGGLDAARFVINPTTGALSFITAPNFEAPGDTDNNNTYEVLVQASDGTLVDIQTLNVRVVNANEAPVITSNGAGPSAALSLNENSSLVTTVTASDVDAATTLAYAISGGADAARFVINTTTGVLRFVAAPDFEAPTDADANNVYDLVVRVSDGTNSDTQALAVTVTDMASGALTVTTVADTVDGDVSSVEALLANAGTDGAISLREALLAANASAGTDQINFAIAGSGVHTIDVQSVLPTITDTLVIDGRTQTGYAGAPLVEINGAAVNGYVDGLVLDAGSDNSVIRGLIVNRFSHANIAIVGGSANNLVAGNHTGTAANGLATLGAAQWGIDVRNGGAGNVIGGTGANDANVIGGNLAGGIAINGSLQTTVIGNFIGVGADGVAAIGNAGGIVVLNNTTGSRIGGVNAAEGNVIANNSGDGIDVVNPSGVSILGNRIFQNGGMAIDLASDNLVQANDTLDADSGANGLQNFPVLTVAELNGSDLHLVGTLDSAANSYYRVEFFADTAADANGHGEGRTWLGFATVTTDISGHGSFDVHLSTSVAVGQVLSATATESNAAFTSYAGTSEFAANRSIADGSNSAPTITSDGAGLSASVAITENTAAVTTVTATDANLPAQTLTYSIIGGADAGQFSINTSTGALTFLTAPNFEAPTDAGTNNVYELVVQVSDGTLADTQALSVAVNNGNEAPVAPPDSYSTAQGTTLTVPAASGLLANDTDPDGDALSVVGLTQPANGTVSLTPGMLTGISNLTQNAAVDTRGDWSPDGSKIVFDSNRDGNNEIYVMNADGTGTVRLTSSAADDSQATWSPDGSQIAFMSNRTGNYDIWVMNANGTNLQRVTSVPSATSGQAAWSPDGSQIAFTSNQSGGNFEIWVVNANGTNPLRLTSASGDDSEPSWSPDGTKIVFATTRDGNSEIYVMNADGSGQTRLTSNAGLDRAPDWSPDGSKIAFISNRSGTSQVWVMDADGANPTAVTAEPAGVGFALWSPDGTKLLFTLGNEIQTANFAYTGGFVYTPTAGFAGADSFSYTVTDSNGLTSTGNVNLSVTAAANVAPLITSQGGGATAAISLAENATAVTTVTATDANLPAQTLVYSISGGVDAALFGINSGTGALAFLAAPNFEAPGDAGANNVYEVIVGVSDGALTDTQALTVTVTNLNDSAPVITSQGGGATAAINVAENQTAVTTVTATDADALAALSYSIAGGADAALFSINTSTGVLSFVSPPNFEAAADAGANNVYDVTVRVSDGTLADIQALAVSVGNVNEAPAITSLGGGGSAALTVAENQTAATTVIATDVDAASTLTYTLSGGADAALFSINASTGELRFLAAPNVNAPGDAGANNVYDLVVRVSDGVLSDSQAMSITVSNVNEAPVLTNQGGGPSASLNVAENQLNVTGLTAVDADAASTLSYAIVGGADASRFAVNTLTGALSFVAAPDFEALADADSNNVYEVIVQVSDGALTDTQALSVNVGNVNEAPVITSNSLAVAEGGRATPIINATDVDSAPGSLVYSVANLSGGRFELTSAAGVAITRFTQADVNAGLLRFVHDSGQAAPAYELTLNDGELGTAAQAATITFTPINDAPVAGSVNLGMIAEDGSRSITLAELLAGAVDADADVLAVSDLRISAGQGGLVDQGNGTWTFTPLANWSGNVTLAFDISDGSASVAASALLRVNAVNDAPRVTSLGGAADAIVAISENTTQVTTLTGSDIDGPAALSYSVFGGADATAFAIDASTGALRFITAPDRENPTDANADNRYDVIVRVSDGTLFAQQVLAVDVNNVDEAPTLVSNTLVLPAAATGGGTTLVLVATDPDTPASALLFQIAGVVGGQFENVGVPGTPITTFTQADVNAGAVVFVQDTSGSQPQYSLQLSDGTSTSPATLVNIVVEAAPELPTEIVLAPVAAPPQSAAAPTTPADAETPSPASPATPVANATATVARGGTAAAEPVTEFLAGPTADTSAQAAAPASVSNVSTSVQGVRHAAVTVELGSIQLAPELVAAQDLGGNTTLTLNDGGNGVAIDLTSALRERSLVQALEPLRREAGGVHDDSQQIVVAGSAASAGLSVGYVLWLARGGVLMASVLSALPAWASLDPLPVLGQIKEKGRSKGAGSAADSDQEDDDGDAVEQLFDKAPADATRAPALRSTERSVGASA